MNDDELICIKSVNVKHSLTGHYIGSHYFLLGFVNLHLCFHLEVLLLEILR